MRRDLRAFLSEWGAPAAAFFSIIALVLLLTMVAGTFILLSQTHQLITEAHATTLAVIKDEILRQTKGAVVVKSACLIVELVNRSLPVAQHISTHGCPPLHLPHK